jgi:hypothetical protein
MISKNDLSALRCRAINSNVGVFDAIDGIYALIESHPEIHGFMDMRGNTITDYLCDIEVAVTKPNESIENLYSAVVELASAGDKMRELSELLERTTASVNSWLEK